MNELIDRISFSLKDPILQQGFEIICKRLVELEQENDRLREQLETNLIWSNQNEKTNSRNL